MVIQMARTSINGDNNADDDNDNGDKRGGGADNGVYDPDDCSDILTHIDKLLHRLRMTPHNCGAKTRCVLCVLSGCICVLCVLCVVYLFSMFILFVFAINVPVPAAYIPSSPALRRQQ